MPIDKNEANILNGPTVKGSDLPEPNILSAG